MCLPDCGAGWLNKPVSSLQNATTDRRSKGHDNARATQDFPTATLHYVTDNMAARRAKLRTGRKSWGKMAARLMSPCSLDRPRCDRGVNDDLKLLLWCRRRRHKKPKTRKACWDGRVWVVRIARAALATDRSLWRFSAVEPHTPAGSFG